MKFRPLFNGFLAALTSSIIVIGALSLALSEGSTIVSPPTAVQETGAFPFPEGEGTRVVGLESTHAPVVFLTATPLLVTSCPAPSAWKPYLIGVGDSLKGLAADYHTTTEIIKKANCMMTDSIIPGSMLFLPAVSSTPTMLPGTTYLSTATPIPCDPPEGWILYQVKPGVTLFHISLMYNVSVDQLMVGNCLSSTHVRTGDSLYIPNVPPRIVPTFPPMTIITPVKTTEVPAASTGSLAPQSSSTPGTSVPIVIPTILKTITPETTAKPK
jgi:LysM repeat protein